MRLSEIFALNEAERKWVEFQNPQMLQDVLEAFLEFLQQEEVQQALGTREFSDFARAEKRVALLRSSLDQSREAGWTKHGYSKGQYGKLAVEPDDIEAMDLALHTVGGEQEKKALTPEFHKALGQWQHHQQMGALRRSLPPTEEGLSVNGSEGLGGSAEGFEQQNQGVTRRRPGEGAKVNGGRAQSGEMDWIQTEANVGDPLSDEEEYGHADWGDPADDPRCPHCGGPDPKIDPSGHYDHMADLFYKKHRLMAPGKSQPLGFQQDDEEAQRLWNDFRKNPLGEQDSGTDPDHRPAFFESWNGYIDPSGFDNQEHRGLTNAGAAITDEAVGDEYDFTKDNSLIGMAMDLDANRNRAPGKPASKHTRLAQSGDTGDFTQDNQRLIQMHGLGEDAHHSRIVWAPGEYGSDIQRVLKHLDRGSYDGSSIWMKLQQAGPAAQVDLEGEEAGVLQQALTHFLATRQYSKPDTKLAEDVLEQLQDMMGESKEIEGMKKSVEHMKGMVAKLKKSSEKEKKEHPWATKAQATQIAKDHLKADKNEATMHGTFILREEYSLKPGDWFRAVQFIDLEGRNIKDMGRPESVGYRIDPESTPVQVGYFDYQVQPDGTFKTMRGMPDSSD